MIKIEALLKEKSYSELTELERLFVLKIMSPEDYESEHKIILLAEKLKLSQTYLRPNSAIKAELMAKMHAKTKQNWTLPMPYRIAASLLFCLGICYFLIKNKSNFLINKTEINAQVNTPNTIKLAQIEPIKVELKPIKIIKNKQIKKPILNIKKETEEEALLLSFNRKNPNLEWQDDEEEEAINLEQLTLKCKGN